MTGMHFDVKWYRMWQARSYNLNNSALVDSASNTSEHYFLLVPLDKIVFLERQEGMCELCHRIKLRCRAEGLGHFTKSYVAGLSKKYLRAQSSQP